MVPSSHCEAFCDGVLFVQSSVPYNLQAALPRCLQSLVFHLCSVQPVVFLKHTFSSQTLCCRKSLVIFRFYQVHSKSYWHTQNRMWSCLSQFLHSHLPPPTPVGSPPATLDPARCWIRLVLSHSAFIHASSSAWNAFLQIFPGVHLGFLQSEAQLPSPLWNFL